jgi:SAM-dependent methyltransferase
VGKVIIDYGCGDGPDAIELARAGARQVIAIDVDEGALERARRRAEAAGVADRVLFTLQTSTTADLVVSSDAFEHVYDIADTLSHIDRLLAPAGEAWVSFGPPWYHPKGGHIFSLFPWAHLLFTEAALTQWRSAFSRGLPITTFAEAGLNRLSVRRFVAAVERSPFRFDYFELVPIQRVRALGLQRLPAARELVTALVKCRLVRRKT